MPISPSEAECKIGAVATPRRPLLNVPQSPVEFRLQLKFESAHGSSGKSQQGSRHIRNLERGAWRIEDLTGRDL